MNTTNFSSPITTNFEGIITKGTKKYPCLDKFENAMNKTLNLLENSDVEACEVFENALFYKLSQIRKYVKNVDPLNPRETKDGYAFVSKYCGRKCKNNAKLTKACLIFLQIYYQEDFDKQMKLLWHYVRRGKHYDPNEVKRILKLNSK